MQKKIARTFHHAMRSTLLIMRAMLLIMRAACPAAELLHGRRRSRTRPRKTRRAHPLHQRRNVAPARQHTTIQRPLAVGLRKVTHRCLLSPLGAFLAPRKAQQFASWPRMAGCDSAVATSTSAHNHRCRAPTGRRLAVGLLCGRVAFEKHWWCQKTPRWFVCVRRR